MTTLGYLFFGQYLQKKGIITFEDIFRARMLQKKNNLKIGQIALTEGLLTSEDIDKTFSSRKRHLTNSARSRSNTAISQKSRWKNSSRNRKRNTCFLEKLWQNSA